MDVRELKKIVALMNENDLIEVEIEEEGKRLRIKKRGSGEPVAHVVAAVPSMLAPGAAPGATPEADTEKTAGGESYHTITAPMVGTFYTAPAPDQDPYVEVGNRVNAESVVCILEAMKVMNEIKADCSGEIIKLCVKNGEAVEYGQELFRVRPS